MNYLKTKDRGKVGMNLTLVIIIVLVLGVVFVNGWTDAPNAIATVVSTRCMEAKKAIYMAAIFNFLGVFVMTAINSKVAFTISNMVDFGSGDNALIALAAALVAIIVWAVAAWWFGIPTSESHALIAGLTGAALAMSGIESVNGGEWIKVIYGLVVSTLIGFGSGFVISKLIKLIMGQITKSSQKVDRHGINSFFGKAQIVSGASMAFLHGAQDGQKFMGVFMLGIFLARGESMTTFVIPFWVMLLCSATMGIGTSIGGYKIIKSVGMDMVKLEKHQGFAADLSASLCLLFSSLTGLPVSTTHTKTTAIMGVGLAKRATAVDWRVVKDMLVAWVVTFPACGLIGYIMSKVFSIIF